MNNDINMMSKAKSMDTYSYKGWLNSDSFWKRAFGVWGYMLAAQMTVAAIGIVVGLVLGFTFASIFRT